MNIDHFSYLIDRRHRLLLIGLIVLMLVAIFMFTGTTSELYGRIVYRTEEPKRFWWNIFGWAFAGLFLIAIYLYQNQN